MPSTVYQTEWDKVNTIQFKMKLNKSADADILEWLGEQDNKQGAIKDLIRQEIAKESQK